ncbi:MAG: hypothetical protein ACKVVT_13220 [Dehalococcoidia bacterium]
MTVRRLAVAAFAAALFALPALWAGQPAAKATTSPVDAHIEGDPASPYVYVVFHTLDRDGLCDPGQVPGSVSLHPVIDMPVDFVIETGQGAIIETSSSASIPANPRGATAVKTFSTAKNAKLAAPVRAFAPLVAGVKDECQAWIKVAQSIPGPLRVLVTAPADGGGTLRWVADLDTRRTATVDLSFRWSLVTWAGADGAKPGEAIANGGAAKDAITAIYGWAAATQTWLAYFPAGATVPGANDLAALNAGSAYWVAIKGPGSVSWTLR